MIVLEQVTKRYRTGELETTALNGISLSVAKGEYVAVVGPSGCGKSTLLSILGLLDRHDGGRFSLDGILVGPQRERERAALRRGKIGFVFQNFNLIEELDVKQNIALALEYLNPRPPRSERDRRVSEVMDRLGIAHRANHHPSQLSGGQQQRVAIARAWVNSPALLLADEPTGNLDSAHGAEVMKILGEMNDRGVTIVMVTHSPEFAKQAGRVISMRDGSIAVDDSQRLPAQYMRNSEACGFEENAGH